MAWFPGHIDQISTLLQISVLYFIYHTQHNLTITNAGTFRFQLRFLMGTVGKVGDVSLFERVLPTSMCKIRLSLGIQSNGSIRTNLTASVHIPPLMQSRISQLGVFSGLGIISCPAPVHVSCTLSQHLILRLDLSCRIYDKQVFQLHYR